jgi:hypothetical protein
MGLNGVRLDYPSIAMESDPTEPTELTHHQRVTYLAQTRAALLAAAGERRRATFPRGPGGENFVVVVGPECRPARGARARTRRDRR